MSRINRDIKDNFDFFQELLFESKVVTEKEILLAQKKSNAYWLTAECNLQHNTLEEVPVSIIIEKSNRDNKYGLKLRCSALTAEPFFRFDSDGPAHRNDDSSIPLEEQSITTPHFNSFDKEGRSIAYKNDTLKDEKKAEIIINDIEFGTSLFCMESKCMLADENFPKVGYKIPEINFEENKETNFDNINFD